jgi:sulfatase maturation enzyme AslB (radical SAM superfamily)
MHTSPYKNQIEKNVRFRHLYEQDYIKRLEFARDNGCNTIILTGSGEPILNRTFLNDFAIWNRTIDSPFKWIELQTSGVRLDEECLRYLRNSVGVSTISLSISDMFDDNNNMEINQTPEELKVNIETLCSEIKRYDFNLRISLNMTNWYNKMPVDLLFSQAKRLGADQITFRKLYISGDKNLHQNKWIENHEYARFGDLDHYIKSNGKALEVLPFGATRYSIYGMSVVIDDDCMSTQIKDCVKYLILRPNCKLYTKWDDEGSLLF